MTLGCAGQTEYNPIPEFIVGGLDYTFELTETLDPGPVKIGFENRGAVPHELILVRLRSESTLIDLISAMNEGNDPVEYTDAFYGILISDPGELGPGRLYIELESGRTYALLCMFQDQEEAPPHVSLGMVSAVGVK